MDGSKTSWDFLQCGEESFGEKNYPVAVENFEKAAKLGDADAMKKLADMYIYGIGVDRDIAKAVKYLEKAADILHDDEFGFSSGECIVAYVQAAYFGSKYALDKVAEIYLESLTAEENELRDSLDSLGKYHFFAESSEKIAEGEELEIGVRYEYKDKYKLSADQASFSLYMTPAAKLGNAKAMAELALVYRDELRENLAHCDGLRIHTDNDKSNRWYLIALRCLERVADFLFENKLKIKKMPYKFTFDYDTCYLINQLADISLFVNGYEAIELYAKVVKLGISDELSEHALKKVAEIYRDGKGGVIPDGNKAIELFTRVYKSGEKSALDKIAEIYLEGKGGVIPEGKKAIELFTKFYENGDKSALDKIAEIYRDGKGGVIPNGNKAIELFTRVYESGDRSALDKIAEIYRDGNGGVIPDGNKAIELFTKTSNMNALAEIYLEGKAGVAPDGYKAIELLTQIADPEKNRLGYGRTIEKIAEIYLEGKAGVAPDGYKAIELLTQAIDPKKNLLGYRTAMKKLASIYKFGRGNVEKNIELAIEWLEKAGCFSEIAEMYRDGVDVKQDGIKVVQYFTKAAELGNTDAMKELAKIYKNAVGGVEKNDVLATEWLEKSCSLIEIAKMYRDGVDVKKNGAKAVQYFTKAAGLGDTYAMKELADIYRNGLDDVEMNLEKSNEWILRMNDLEPYGIF